MAAVALGVSVPATAQTAEDDGLDYKPYPHMFVGIQGGGQTTFTNYDNMKLITKDGFVPSTGADGPFHGGKRGTTIT